jgi:hypothetical protein
MFGKEPSGKTADRAVASVDNSAEVQMSGMVLFKDGRYFLRDEKSGRTIELRGNAVKHYSHKRVTVSGRATGPPGSTEVILVSKISTGTAGAGPTAAPAATTKGMSGVTMTAIGTAAAAGLVGSLYLSGSIGEDQPASRP